MKISELLLARGVYKPSVKTVAYLIDWQYAIETGKTLLNGQWYLAEFDVENVAFDESVPETKEALSVIESVLLQIKGMKRADILELAYQTAPIKTIGKFHKFDLSTLAREQKSLT